MTESSDDTGYTVCFGQYEGVEVSDMISVVHIGPHSWIPQSEFCIATVLSCYCHIIP